MGWQLINAVVTADFGSNSTRTEGYLVGTDDEQGYLCFKKSPFINKPFISQKYWPTLVVDGSTSYNVQGKLYDWRPVFEYSSTTNIFRPTNNDGKWVQGSFLKEPYYYTDIDETVKGDSFYEGNLPDLDGTETWTHAGNNVYSPAATIEVKMTQTRWIWVSNGDRNQSKSGFCGAYQNPEDQTWKFVGLPVFEATTNNNTDYYRNEKFTRSLEKEGGYWGHFTYIGDKGHIIRYTQSKWAIGTPNTGKWSEASQEPSTQNEVSFSGYEMDSGTGDRVADPRGDFTLTFKHREMGTEKKTVYMGEVSLWR